MNIDSIQNFIALSQEKNITKTAERLFISQPALTKQIHSLENELSTQLIKRKTNGIELTKSGEIFLEYAKAFVTDYEKMLQDIEYADNTVMSDLTVGYTTNFHRTIIEKAIPHIYTISTDLSISVVQKMPQDLISMIKHGNLPCAFMHLPSAKNDNGVEYVRIIKGGIGARIEKTDPLANNKEISVNDLNGYTQIINEFSCPKYLEFVQKPFIDNNIQLKKKYVKGKSNVELIAGIGKTFALSSEHSITTDNIACVPIKELRQGADIVLVYKKGNMNSTIRKFRDIVQNICNNF